MKPRLLFFCSRLGGGGAEMHLTRILNEADFDEYDIHLALTRGGGSYEAFLDERVTVHHLNPASVASSTGALLRSARPLDRLIRALRPAAVISFMDVQNILLAGLRAGRGRRFPHTILCCQNAPGKSLSDGGPFDALTRALLPTLYNKADKIIAISKGVKRDLVDTFGVRTPIEVIYNAGFGDQVDELIAQPLPDGVAPAPGQLVACGRLTRQKAFDTLFRALALIGDRRPFSLWLLGTGKDKDALTALAAELGIADRVHFLGFQANPFPFFHHAEAFVLSSRWEGFGNVIVEAMVSGTPVVSTRCDFGPDEIITHGVNGLLADVDDPPQLAQAIETILGDSGLRMRLALAGLDRARDFRAESISRQYFQSIAATVKLTVDPAMRAGTS